MDNTRQLVRRNWGYIVVLAVLLLYAHIPTQCGNPAETARALLKWIETWTETPQ